MGLLDLLEQRGRRLVGIDRNFHLPDDVSSIGGWIHDVEERDPRSGQAAEDRPGNGGTAAVPWQKAWMHAEDTVGGQRDERLPHQLGPPDDEDHLGFDSAELFQALLGVDVIGLDQLRADPRRYVVEAALARPSRIDWAR